MLRWLRRRIAGTTNTVKLLAADPKSAGSMMRRATVRLWRARGGGLFGLGYVICFGVLQVRSFTEQIATSTSVEEFVIGEIAQHLFRFGVDSFVNAFLSLLWPAYVLDYFSGWGFGGWGIVILVVGFWAFERWLRPLVERRVPELGKRPDQGAH